MSSRILLLLKPDGEKSAIVRVSEFAKFLPELEVVAVNIKKKDDTLSDEHYKRQFATLKKYYPSIQNFEHKILEANDKSVVDTFVLEAKEGNYDMAIIPSSKRKTMFDLFSSPLASNIMRKIPIPLLIVKDSNASQKLEKAILLAIDFESDDHEKLVDELLIKAANSFAKNFNGEIHIANCVTPKNRGTMSGETTLSTMLHDARTRKDIHREILDEFADTYHIPKENRHVLVGRVDEQIPKLSQKLNARMVCMGTDDKSSFISQLTSSAAPLVLEQIKGDLFVVNKLTVVSK